MVTTEGRSMTKYSITRSPTYPSAVLKGAFAASTIFSTARDPLNAQSASARAMQRPGSRCSFDSDWPSATVRQCSPYCCASAAIRMACSFT